MDAINSVKTKECGKQGVENTQSAFGVIHNAVASINEGKIGSRIVDLTTSLEKNQLCFYVIL